MDYLEKAIQVVTALSVLIPIICGAVGALATWAGQYWAKSNKQKKEIETVNNLVAGGMGLAHALSEVSLKMSDPAVKKAAEILKQKGHL